MVFNREETQVRSLALAILIVSIFYLSSSGLLAGETSKRSPSRSATAPSFVLSTQQARISLDATNASLKAIVEQIGRELNIRVDAYVGADDKVTAQFDTLTIEQAIKRLSDNYALFRDEHSGKISGIAVFPVGEDPSHFLGARETQGTASRKPEAQSSQPTQPEPFKFEFDPSKLGKHDQ